MCVFLSTTGVLANKKGVIVERGESEQAAIGCGLLKANDRPLGGPDKFYRAFFLGTKQF